MPLRHLLCISIAALAIAACKRDAGRAPSGAAPAPTSAASATAVVAPAPVRALAAPVREGGALVRTAAGDALLVADEDHRMVRRVPLPLEDSPDAGSAVVSVTVPGAPAQVLALGDGRVLVTLRDPGALLVLKPDPSAVLAEEARIALPADAWGVAITPDEKTAIVTSAWTHQVSAVDLGTRTKRWSIDVAREPRGVVVRADGVAYVTHLVGAALTRIDDLGGAAPRALRIDLPPAPARAPSGRTVHASLGYAAVLSDDGSRLFVARHALGALGEWWGAATVDVLATAGDVPVLQKHTGGLPAARDVEDLEANILATSAAPFTQPRAMIYRRTTRTLLVASEGDDRVVELDALSPAPAAVALDHLGLGTDHEATIEVTRFDYYSSSTSPEHGVARRCAAPSGLALSEAEDRLYVFCRGTYDLASFVLRPLQGSPPKDFEWRIRTVPLAGDPIGGDASQGRRFFYSSSDIIVSGGMACAGCHPEGRDDGMVWHEAIHDDDRTFVGAPEAVPGSGGHTKSALGFPRQTPMLAGRVGAPGPYGWHAQSKDLAARLEEGFGLHRWGKLRPGQGQWGMTIASDVGQAEKLRIKYLAAFLRQGLVTPPREARTPTPQEERGREIFNSPAARCARCHVPDTEYTDRTAYPLPRLAPPGGFEDEKDLGWKTPSLLFVGGTPPYFHDGHAATLEELVDKNDDRMGNTKQLSGEDRAALVAFLKTL